jgi:hypothetical protein
MTSFKRGLVIGWLREAGTSAWMRICVICFRILPRAYLLRQSVALRLQENGVEAHRLPTPLHTEIYNILPDPAHFHQHRAPTPRSKPSAKCTCMSLKQIMACHTQDKR